MWNGKGDVARVRAQAAFPTKPTGPPNSGKAGAENFVINDSGTNLGIACVGTINDLGVDLCDTVSQSRILGDVVAGFHVAGVRLSLPTLKVYAEPPPPPPPSCETVLGMLRFDHYTVAHLRLGFTWLR